MKILLVNPPNSVPLDSDFHINVFQPIGLAYVAAMLEKHGHQVSILDALALGHHQSRTIDGRRQIGLSPDDIKNRIAQFQPQLVGIGAPFSFQSGEIHKIAQLTKSYDPKTIVVAGGSHVTIQPQDLISDPNVDYTISGEGEYTLLALVEALEANQSPKSIPGLSYKTKKKVFHNPKGLPIRDLNALPQPARHLLPLDSYHQASLNGQAIESLIAYGSKRTSIFTSRGCPFTCSFCSVHLTMTRSWRPRSPQNVLEEIQTCVRKFGITYFDFLDDNFNQDMARAKEICRLIIAAKLNIRWSTPNGIRADHLDDELVSLMKQSGCLQVKVAPESGNQKILDTVIRKHLQLEQVKQAVRLCARHGLSCEAFFVIGFPQESIAEIWDTINFGKTLRSLGCDHCYFFIATPYYGTDMFNTAVASGYLNPQDYHPDLVLTTTNKSLLTSPNFTHQQLLDLQKVANAINPPVTRVRLIGALRLFFKSPRRLIRQLFWYLSLQLKATKPNPSLSN